MQQRPFLPNERVVYRFYLDEPPHPGTVLCIHPSGLIRVELDNGSMIDTYRHYLKHINC